MKLCSVHRETFLRIIPRIPSDIKNRYYLLNLCINLYSTKHNFTKILLLPFEWSQGPLGFIHRLKAEVQVKTVMTSLNTAFLPISRSRFKLNLYAHFINHCWQFCVNFWAFLERDIFFSKDRLNWGKYEMLKIWWIWKIESEVKN